MGRKKKINKESEQPIVTNVQNIGYQGTLNVSILHGKRVIQKTKYHNSGMPNLFRFLVNCLGGNYAAGLRPNKIRLFYFKHLPNETEELKPEYNPATVVWSNFRETDIEAVTPYLTWDATPVITEVPDTTNRDNTYYTINFHFSVPFSYISGTRIHAVGLYASDSSDILTPSAYYLFTDETTVGDITTYKWHPLELTTAVGDYSIIIDWTLSVSNKVKK